ncbi:class I SAM-dependent methyltransferase [Rhodocaloribacter litoris]|uniref:class I SAM-dependent methyltransferase n=1 Tax=Rhodocaloribacter litoris TaxID=2558931 RepID=UPI001420BB05|nr:class I SAM-dependent methyltransferase [Rhodocaloribacter litoris]QXD15885.1 class I SAM-dependent methyltransferase [Rhodocaloribacter litoris]
MIATLEWIACPYCGADDAAPWGEEAGYTAVQCRPCGFVYVNPRPPLDAIDEAAQTGIHTTERGTVNVVSRIGFRRDKVRMFRKRMAALYPEHELRARPVRWLDVGAGFGELLAALENLVHPASRLEGIEPCLPKVEVARRHGLYVSARTLSEVHETYDVISLINVFSHLPDPAAFLGELTRRLEPDGEIVLVTGNGADVRREEYPDALCLPDHLVFAGERHVRGLFDRLGFEMVQVHRYRYFLLDPLPLRVVKNVVKRVLGRPVTRPNTGPFRSLFVRARRKAHVPRR